MVALTDSFARVGNLAGSSTDTGGGTWSVANGTYTTTGTAADCTGVAGSGLATATVDGLDPDGVMYAEWSQNDGVERTSGVFIRANAAGTSGIFIDRVGKVYLLADITTYNAGVTVPDFNLGAFYGTGFGGVTMTMAGTLITLQNAYLGFSASFNTAFNLTETRHGFAMNAAGATAVTRIGEWLFTGEEPVPPDPEGQATYSAGARVGELGCGEYRVLVMNRCGSLPICDISKAISEIDGSPFRVMDDTSQVTVTVDLTGAEGAVCCECLGGTRSWIHSLVIERDGAVVWGPGPIVNILYKREQVVVTARDVSAWLDRRVIHNDYEFFEEPVSTVVRTLLEDALGPDDPCGLIGYLTIETSTTLIDKSVIAREGTAGDVLRDMARNYLDYTVVGQRIVIAETLTYGPYTRLDDGDFQTELEIEERGLETGTKWYLNGDGVEGECGGLDPYLGLIEQVVTEDSLEDEDIATAAACSRLQASNPSPVYINVPEGAQLSARAQVMFSQLIPGTLVDVALDDVCRPLAVRNRLTAVSLKVTGDGDEAVGVTLSPLGTGYTEAGGVG